MSRRTAVSSGARWALAMVVAVAIAGCGGAPRAEVAEMFVSVAAEDGFNIDAGCVEQVLGAMSDDDVTKLNDAGLDGAADLSEQGVGVLTDIRNQCIDVGQFIDSVIGDIELNPATTDVDVDCVREGLANATSVDDVDRALERLLVVCGPADT